MNSRLLLALPLAALLAGCGAARKTARQSNVIELSDLEVTDKKGPKPYQPTPTRSWDILHTDLKVSFDIPARKIMGTATLRVKPYAYAQDTFFLDAKTMEFDAVKAQLGGKTISPRFKKQEGGYLLHFDKALTPADTLLLTISYTAEPYKEAAAGGRAIVEERGLYFVNAAGKIPGKPLQIWTQGETESNSHWFPTIDKPGEKFTMELAIQVPESLLTISNGVLYKSEKVAGGQRTDHWKMEQPVQAYAYMMTIGDFAKIEDTPFEGKPIIYYVEHQYAPYAKAIFSNTPKMVQFFSDYTGVKYPWPKYSQIAVRDYVSGAMENTSSSLFGEFVNGNARERLDNPVEGVVAHELYHQWFGDYVTAESWNNLTLNESFATDGEVLWLNYHNGTRAADAQRYNYLQRYLSGSQRNDAPLVRNYWNGPDEVFDHISYQKGGQILFYIRQLAGEEKFRRAMNLYLQKHAYGTAEAADWRMALEEATGTDWTAFFDQWYYKGGHPKVNFSYLYDDARRQVKVVARQPADSVFNLPIKVGVYNNDPIVDLPDNGRLLNSNETIDNGQKWTLLTASDTLTIRYSGSERPLIVPDVEHVIIGRVVEKKSDTLWIAQMRLAKDHISQRRATIATSDAKFSKELAAARLQLLKNEDPALQQLTYAILAPEKGNDWRNYPGIMQQAELHFKDLKEDPKVRASALVMWYQWNKKEAIVATVPTLLNDSSYLIAGTALNALFSVDSSAGREAARKILLQGDAKGFLLGVSLGMVANDGQTQDFQLLIKGSETVWGQSKTQYLAALTAFFMETKDSVATQRAAQKLVQWYGEEEATFVRRRQIANSWEELVQDVQGYSPADREIVTVRRRILLESLAGIATSESDPGIVKTLADMQKRIQESAKSDTRK